jgi:hypothetical protein
MRAARRAGYTYPPGGKGQGRRFLTDRELQEWHARLDVIIRNRWHKLSLVRQAPATTKQAKGLK